MRHLNNWPDSWCTGTAKGVVGGAKVQALTVLDVLMTYTPLSAGHAGDLAERRDLDQLGIKYPTIR